MKQSMSSCSDSVTKPVSHKHSISDEETATSSIKSNDLTLYSSNSSLGEVSDDASSVDFSFGSVVLWSLSRDGDDEINIRGRSEGIVTNKENENHPVLEHEDCYNSEMGNFFDILCTSFAANREMDHGACVFPSSLNCSEEQELLEYNDDASYSERDVTVYCEGKHVAGDGSVTSRGFRLIFGIDLKYRNRPVFCCRPNPPLIQLYLSSAKQEVEEEDKSVVVLHVDRRKIFAEECLTQYDGPIFHSTPSSLRQCRYSGRFRRTVPAFWGRDGSQRSVSFSDVIKVEIFEKAIEQYAASTWSERFS